MKANIRDRQFGKAGQRRIRKWNQKPEWLKKKIEAQQEAKDAVSRIFGLSRK
jgi:hypothetical protein